MTDLPKVDSSAAKVKDDGGQVVAINGPEKLEIDESMPTETGTGTDRPRRRCMPCRCTRFTAAVLSLAVLSLILAALLIASVVRLSRRPTCGAADDDAGTASLTDGPGRVLSDLADDGSRLPWTDIRLPRTVIAESYALRLRVDPSNEWFHGAVDIDVTVKSDWDLIVLHASSLDVGNVNNIIITHKVSSSSSSSSWKLDKSPVNSGHWRQQR